MKKRKNLASRWHKLLFVQMRYSASRYSLYARELRGVLATDHRRYNSWRIAPSFDTARANSSLLIVSGGTKRTIFSPALSSNSPAS